MRERERGWEREVRVDRPNSGQIHKKIKNKQSAQSVMKERRKEEEYKKGSLTAQCIKADTHTHTHSLCRKYATRTRFLSRKFQISLSN